MNNAAILIPGRVDEMQVQHWDLLYRGNVRSPFLGCRFVLPHMKRQGYGHIINISSTGAVGPGLGPTLPRAAGHRVRRRENPPRSPDPEAGPEVWGDGIAANNLSPRRAIASGGQRWFLGDARSYAGARQDGIIMGDAELCLCTHDSKSYTGRVLYDEEVLAESGVTDLSQHPVLGG